MKFSDQEIDALLASVEAAMSHADKLAKSMPMKKDGEDEQAAEAPAPDMAPDAPTADASADAAPEAAPEQPAADPAADPAAQGDDQLQADAQDQGEISDEELHEIYASMQPEELQRHQAIIQALMAQAQAPAAADPAMAGAPQAPQAPAASPDMSQDMAMKGEAGEAEANATAPAKAESMGKSEQFKKLESENDALKKSLDKVVAAMEKAFKPTRKAVTNLEYVKKSEDSTNDKPLVKSEVLPKLNELTRSGILTKSDRAAINDYVLNNGSQDQVKNILKGGK